MPKQKFKLNTIHIALGSLFLFCIVVNSYLYISSISPKTENLPEPVANIDSIDPCSNLNPQLVFTKGEFSARLIGDNDFSGVVLKKFDGTNTTLKVYTENLPKPQNEYIVWLFLPTADGIAECDFVTVGTLDLEVNRNSYSFEKTNKGQFVDETRIAISDDPPNATLPTKLILKSTGWVTLFQEN